MRREKNQHHTQEELLLKIGPKIISRTDKFLQERKVRLLLSEERLNEVSQVISRPKIKKYFTDNAWT
jgi:predicted nucleic acid-binding protein